VTSGAVGIDADAEQAVGLLLILPQLERSADLAEHIAQRALTGRPQR
jgi:phosphate uptake regulator